MKFFLLILMLFLLMQCMSCYSSNNSESEKTTGSSDQTIIQEDEYNYEGKKFQEYIVRIMSTCDFYTMHMEFDREEENGEVLNDAIYNRNRYVEEKLNIKFENIVVADTSAWATNNLVAANIKKAVEAGDDICDLAFIPPKSCASMIVGGYFYNLKDYEGFQLDKPWYNQSYNEIVTLKEKLYFGMSDATVGLTDGMWAMFFNEDKMEDLKMDLPYDLVREGKWTFDRLREYLVASANLNGDDSYTWKKDGNSFYGLTMMPYFNYRFMNCFGEKIIENVNGKLKFTAGSERFMNAAEMLTKTNDKSLGLIYNGVNSDYDAENGGYVYPFMVQRAMFLTAEICKTQKYREFDFTYGILPCPKYDENQENYITTIYQEALAFSIPITCKTPERTAEIFDALSYEGMKSVVPAYREITVEQKGLRNEDSIEMLGIITDGAFADVGSMYALNETFISDFYSEVVAGTGAMSSLIAKSKNSIEDSIEKLMSEIK